MREHKLGNWVPWEDHQKKTEMLENALKAAENMSHEKAVSIATGIWSKCTNDRGDLQGKDTLIRHITAALEGKNGS